MGDRPGLRLPAGRWLAIWKQGTVLREREFELRAGAVTALDLANVR
jgi:hypothetical protein